VSLRTINGIGGGALGADYWVRDVSPVPCSLASPVTVDLADGEGRALLSLSAPLGIGTPNAPQRSLTLPPHAVIPPEDANPTPGTILGVTIQYVPIDEVNGGRVCPAPLTPSSLRLRFGPARPISTTAVGTPGRSMSVCNRDASVVFATLIT
jgi:hypothetical protein